MIGLARLGLSGWRTTQLVGFALVAGLLLLLLLLGMGQAPGHRLARAPVMSPVQVNASALPARLAAITVEARPPLAEGEDAKVRNSTLPLVANGLQQALPFLLVGGQGAVLHDRAQECLALAMYYEAGFEGRAGRLAVGQVVLNRVRHPAFPHSVCSVVFQRSASVCQFTFACDGAMSRRPVTSLWQQAKQDAAELLAGEVNPSVGMATHYHANYVVPWWAPKLEKIATIGAHIFYRWPSTWGRRDAFSARYAGTETMPGTLASLDTLAAEELKGADSVVKAASADGPVILDSGGLVDPTVGWVPKTAQYPTFSSE